VGYIYGLRMDLIGQSDGVGLHRAVGSYRSNLTCYFHIGSRLVKFDLILDCKYDCYVIFTI
jgi:hypothetical protein